MAARLRLYAPPIALRAVSPDPSSPPPGPVFPDPPPADEEADPLAPPAGTVEQDRRSSGAVDKEDVQSEGK